MSSSSNNKEYANEIEKARRDLRALISAKNCAPIMLRLAWHDAGTYDAKTKSGGPNGSIRLPEELNHKANTGLKFAVDLCEQVKSKHPIITYADLYQDSNKPVEEGRLPDATQGASHLRDVFYRMCLNDKDIVVLSGGHTLGKAHLERSGFEGAWTKDPLKFDNSYFKQLLDRNSKGLLKLPTDKVLVEDLEFRRYVEHYAKNEDAFFEDYAASHKKLSELGFKQSGGINVKTIGVALVVSIGVALIATLLHKGQYHITH